MGRFLIKIFLFLFLAKILLIANKSIVIELQTKFNKQPWLISLIKMLFIIICAMTILYFSLIWPTIDPPTQNDKLILNKYNQDNLWNYLEFVFDVIILASIAEEIFFRYLLFSFFKKPSVQIFVTSIIFGLAHLHKILGEATDSMIMINLKYYITNRVYFIGGLMLGVIYYKFGIISAILVHMTVNLLAILLILN